MPYTRKSTRTRPYKKRYVRRKPTVRNLARKVNKLTLNASRYYDEDQDMSASTTASFVCPQTSIAQGDGPHNRDSNNTYTRKLYVDYMAQANDPEGNVGRFMIFIMPDGTVPTFPTTVHSAISPMTTNTRQYCIFDHKFSVGAYQAEASSGTSTNSYYPWHRIRKTIMIPKKFQKNWYQSSSGDVPTNAVYLAYMSDSISGNSYCFGNTRTYFSA